MARRKTWQEKATFNAITTKINRRKNPVTSYAQLAEEFGAPVSPSSYYTGWTSTFTGTTYPGGGSGRAASSSFRSHVKRTLGVGQVEFAKA